MITITKEVALPTAVRVITINVDIDIVEVTVSDKEPKLLGGITMTDHFPWDKLDADTLADAFELETVAVFKVILETMGKLHANEAFYKEIVA